MRATLPMFLSLCFLALGLAAPLALALPSTGDPVVAVQAGTIHLVQDGLVIEGGGTLLLSGGKIVAVGADVSIPAGARVVDYGPEAVIIPGLVAADSYYASSIAAGRTATPSLRAVDQFDPYSNLYSALTGGVTSVYLAPARGRLVAGQGAVVKSGGDPDVDRVLTDSAAIHGSIAAEARRTPGYWVPPVPATVDVGLGVEQPQLPRTTMGAVVALEELLALIAGDDGLAELYGPETAQDLGTLVDEGRPWRMGADDEEEVRALLEFFAEAKLPLVLDTRVSSAKLAEDIAAAGVPVIAAPHVRGTTDFGKTPESDWPSLDGVSTLVAAGVRVAVVPARVHRTGDLRFAAALAQRGGLDAAAALRSITLTPAEILGVDERVGSLVAGKDADLVVLNGSPLDMTASVLATWVGGEVLWKAHETAATVIEVDELHLGDGHVLRPGQVLMENGRIREVGARVAHPLGATVVRGAAAMPGMIDTLGHLGLEGSRKSFSTRFDLKRLLEPGDYADRRVARGGVTTVNLGSRSSSGNSPTMAYKPAGSEVERMLIEAPATMRLTWSSSIRADAGNAVRTTLQKAAEYKQKWAEYEKAIAEWKPEVAKEKEEESEEGEDGDGSDDDESDEKKDKKDKKKKKKDEKEPARPVTGEWTGTVTHGDAPSDMRLRLRERDLTLEGTLRVEGLHDLVSLEGSRDEYAVTLSGLSSLGWLEITLELDDKQLTGKGLIQGVEGPEAVIELTQSSEDYPVAQRPERRKEKPAEVPKSKPKSPGINPELEPLRKAMAGTAAVIVSVSREDEILECVAEFEKYGIRPVLFGAENAYKVSDRLRGRVAGVIPAIQAVSTSTTTGTRERNRYAELANVGIPVAFHSSAEEGAVELATSAAYAVSHGMSPQGAVRALTLDAARMLAIDDRVGSLRAGLDADLLLLDGSPLQVSTSVLRVWVNGKEIR